MIIEGYGALFGVEDHMRDVVRAGAFAASLARRTEFLPIFVEHDPRLRAGYWRHAQEDRRGLWLVGEIDPAQPGARRAMDMLARGVDGLSIGFVSLAAQHDGARRILIDVELLEVSIVTHPMQPQARLTCARECARAA